MPQANITYENSYNDHLVNTLREMDDKHWSKAGTAYAPTMFVEKLGNFHGEKIGGGSPGGQQYAVSGNGNAYPPFNLNAGLQINSGGSYAGVDGAVGGKYRFNDFIGDVAGVGKAVAPDLIRAAIGRGRKCGGSKIGKQIASVARTLAPFAPLLMGLGHPQNVPIKKHHIVAALAHLGAKKSHTLKKLKEVAMKGGYSFNDFVGDVAGVGKEVAPDLIRAAMKRGKGRSAPLTSMVAEATPVGGRRKRYSVDNFVGDFNKIGNLVKPVAKPIISALTDAAVSKIRGAGRRKKYSVDKFVEDFNKIGKLVKPVAKPIISALTDKAVSKIQGAGKKTNKRAEIVKKVMKEKGMKMIEASKYVKQNGLY